MLSGIMIGIAERWRDGQEKVKFNKKKTQSFYKAQGRMK
jgi:hypothetical protein